MGRPPNVVRRGVVEDSETLRTSDGLRCLKLGIRFSLIPTHGAGQRLCLLCPMCDSLSVQTVVMRSQPYRLKKDPAFRDDAERTCPR
jgi:hypothetical protein